MAKCCGNWILVAMSVVLLVLAALCWKMTPVADQPQETENCGLSVRISNPDADSDEIQLWRATSGEYSVFLPSHSCLEDAEFAVKYGYSVFLDGNMLRDGMSCGAVSSGVRYTLEWEQDNGNGGKSTLTFYTGSTLPAVYLDVRSGSMQYIHSYKGAEESGTVRIVLPDGTVDYQGNLESLAGRGNATWENKEKKPYNLKLRTQGELLGMGQAQNWVLLANAYDDSHIRNKIVYDTAAELGLAYSPQSRWVELYLNGEYAGLYLLCEKNEIHESRVDIDTVNGNLISIEKEDRLWEYDQQFVTEGGTPIRIRRTADQEELQNVIGRLEQAMLADDGVDPVTGESWLQMIDLQSWVKKYLIEEAFGNLDAGSISQFFYWENGGKIYAGPVWDYDVSLGCDGHWQLQDVNMLYAGRPHLWSESDSPWFYALSQKPEFQAELERVYAQELRPLLLTLAESGVADCSREIAQAARRNQLRWGTQDAGEEAEQILSYMIRRVDFLDSLWLENTDYNLVQLHMNWLVMGCYAILPGETVPEQPVPGNWENIEYLGWYDMESGQPYDFSQPVNRDLYLYLKETENGQEVNTSSGGLSGKIWLIPVSVFSALFAVMAAVEILRIGKTRKEREMPRKAAQGNREAL